VNDIKDSCLQSCGGDRSEWVLRCRVGDIGANTKLLYTRGEVLGNVAALDVSTYMQGKLTFMAMNFRTRYCVKTLMTTSPSVFVSLSIRGKRRACV
jgi:hypothetical protein